MKTALLSVYDKEGIEKFARELVDLGWEILASGGTAKVLAEANIPVGNIADLVGKPILGHRVVTLSREIHAALLATDSEGDNEELSRLGIPRIDLVCVDFYPLEEEVNSPGATTESVIEKTDIGGPALLRSAAKGRRIVICDPNDRPRVVEWLKDGQPNEKKVLDSLAAKAEGVVADYCLASARYHSRDYIDGFAGIQTLSCAYGENPWQGSASLLSCGSDDPLSLNKFTLVAGSPPSYNNLCDIDRLLQTTTHIAAVFDLNRGEVPRIAVGAKHGNACGAAVGEDAPNVLQRMIEGDTRAIFGGLVMTNFPIGEKEAEVLLNYKMGQNQRRLLDGVIAPSFSDEAVAALRRKGDKCRFLTNLRLATLSVKTLDASPRFRYVRGGFLRQPNYTFVLDFGDSSVEKLGDLTKDQEGDLLLAWAVGSCSNSNTVTLVKNKMLIGNGVGQQDRVGGCELAIRRAQDAGHDVSCAAAYSDSFFPFPDGPEVLAKAGVSAILASSGSVKDEEIKEFCKKTGLILYMIPDKIGRGFFGH